MTYIKKKSSLFALFVILAAVFCAYAVQTAVTQRIRGVTIQYVQYELSADGTRTELGTETAYVSANGSWRTERRSRNGHVEQVLLTDISRAGVFLINGGSREAVKVDTFTPRTTPHTNAAGYRSHSNFIGEEVVLGFTAFVQRIISAEGRVEAEYAFVPEFDTRTVKAVHYRSDGSRRILEAVSINFGEPDARLFQVPANMPIVEAIVNPMVNQ